MLATETRLWPLIEKSLEEGPIESAGIEFTLNGVCNALQRAIDHPDVEYRDTVSVLDIFSWDWAARNGVETEDFWFNLYALTDPAGEAV